MSDNILLQTAQYEKFPMTETVYAPKWYYSKEVTSDGYSTKLYHSKKENKSWYFRPYINDLIDALRKFGMINFDDVDIVTIIPSHEPGVFSVTLERLGPLVSILINASFEKILMRIKNTHPAGVRLHDASDRYNNVSGSLNVTRKLSEKKVVILDDIKTTGIHILEAKKILFEAGVNEMVSICLGINSPNIMEIETMVTPREGGGLWIQQG